MNDIDRLLADIAALWNSIEGRAKQVEQFNGKAIIACINEMRYAGRRIVDVLVAQKAVPPPPERELLVELGVAKNYLMNADHDLTDAVILEVHIYIQRVIKKHGLPRINQHLPEFGSSLYPLMEDANTIVTGSREDRRLRAAEYDRLAKDYIPKLMDLSKRLKAIKQLSIPENDIKWSLVILTWITVIGSGASIAGVILGAIGAWPIMFPDRAPEPSAIVSAPAPATAPPA